MKNISEDPVHDRERKIIEHLSSPSLKADPRNHTVELLDVLRLPLSGQSTLVMPLLRRFNDPPFETVGEAVEFFRQIFEVCVPKSESQCYCVADVVFLNRVCSSCMSMVSLTGLSATYLTLIEIVG